MGARHRQPCICTNFLFTRPFLRQCTFAKVCLEHFHFPIPRKANNSIEISVRLFSNLKFNRIGELYRAIDEYDEKTISTRPAMETTINEVDCGEPCLARVNGKLNRGVLVDIIFGPESTTMSVFFVDTGETAKCDIDDVYDIPSYLIKMLSYQAIRCRMFGITSVSQSPEWTSAVVDGIYDQIEEALKDGLYAYIVTKNELDNEPTHLLDKYCHQVILLDAASKNINRTIVSMGLAKFEPGAESRINALAGKLVVVDEEFIDENNRNDDTDANSESDWEDSIDEKYHKDSQITNVDDASQIKQTDNAQDYQLNMDELEMDSPETDAFLDSFFSKVPETESFEEKVVEKQVDEFPTEGNQSTVDSTPPKSTKSHRLIYLYKRPAICWHQTDDYIGLKISATENCKYALKVGIDSFVYRYYQYEYLDIRKCADF